MGGHCSAQCLRNDGFYFTSMIGAAGQFWVRPKQIVSCPALVLHPNNALWCCYSPFSISPVLHSQYKGGLRKNGCWISILNHNGLFPEWGKFSKKILKNILFNYSNLPEASFWLDIEGPDPNYCQPSIVCCST